MHSLELKVAAIGNSRGVRLPADTLKRYGILTSVVMEERSDGILLRPTGRAQAKLSWEETALEMAAEHEDWSAWDTTVADGLHGVPWEPVRSRREAEPQPEYRAGKGARKRR